MTSDPLVSVVMSVYNGERFLRPAVESILLQSFRDFEFIIINDGSTDGSASLLEALRDSDSRVRVYHQENQGLINSLKRGCELPRGKYIARMDADDIAIQDRVAWQVEFMEKHVKVGVVGGHLHTVDATGRTLRTVRHPVEDSALRQALLRGIVAICHPTVLMRKEAFSSSAGFRAALQDAEDYDLWLRISDRYLLANLDRVVLKYRIHNNQVSLRNRRQQTMSILAAHAAALARRAGKPDPLSSVDSITSDVLARLGVSRRTEQTTLARHYLGWIRNMCLVGEYESAMATASEMFRSSGWESADRWVIADTQLAVARIYWKQRKRRQSFITAGRAIMTNPVMIARPLKPLLGWFGFSKPPIDF